MRAGLLFPSRCLIALALFGPGASAQWIDLLRDRSLSGWEKIGDGLWSLTKDGTLIGQRDLNKAENQAWLYTRKEFGQFDLRLEYWLRFRGNSGVSIRDTSRAQYAHPPNWNAERTPSHTGYEIQLFSGKTEYPSGSIYLFEKAKAGVEAENDWNALEIESRNDMIRTKINGQLVCRHPGDPARPKAGPIGLQLHDRNTVVMFRNVRIREFRK